MGKLAGMPNISIPHYGPQFATPAELAAVLKISRPQVMAYFRRGIIPAEIAIGRVYRFDVEKCVEALRKHSETEENGGAV